MNEESFTRRILQSERKLYRVAFAMLRSDADSADAVQQALLIAWCKRSSLREPQYFETWLIRILINECKRMLRQRKGSEALLSETLPAPEPPDPALRDAIYTLERKYRLPLLLHHLEGYNVREIAQMLGVPQSTVKGRLYRARKQLMQALNEEVGFE